MHPLFPHWLAEFCGSAPIGAGLLVALFVAGVAGSALHCAPMCGGFVLGQVADRMARVPAARLCELHRLGAGMLLPYHLGRLTTYAGLGAVAGLSGAALGVLSPVLLGLGALLFFTNAARALLPRARRFLPSLDRAPAGWSRLCAAAARRAGGGYPLGLALGFLPCGFLYAALAASSAGGSAALGAAGMLAFGLGTVPALVVVGVAGHAAGRRWQRGIAIAGPMVMLFNGALLTLLALRGI